jgi:competence protein ComFC
MVKQYKRMIEQMIRCIREGVPRLLSPHRLHCSYCHIQKRNHEGMLGLCVQCMQTIPWIRNVECSVCGRYEACTDCERRQLTHYVMNRSAVRYSSEMREWLARYKYRGDESLLPLLIEMLRFPFESLQQFLSKSQKRFDCITYIPLSSERLAERGFNQAEQLSLGIGEAYNIPVFPLLKRVLHTGKQSYKTRGQRLNDLHNVFTFAEVEIESSNSILKSKGSEPLHILIIDDVYTTGSTLNECASIIRQHLHAQIYGLTWAR